METEFQTPALTDL